MRLVNSMRQDIYLNGAIANSDDFKDGFVDELLKIRDCTIDKSGQFPIITMSSNTFNWFKRLFQTDSSFVADRFDGYGRFWAMEIKVADMRDGLIDFYING